jgi:hypothetical protein
MDSIALDGTPVRISLRCRQCRRRVGSVSDTKVGPFIVTNPAPSASERHHENERAWLATIPAGARERLEQIAREEWEGEGSAGPPVHISPLRPDDSPGAGYLDVRAACRTHGELVIDRGAIATAYDALALGRRADVLL